MLVFFTFPQRRHRPARCRRHDRITLPFPQWRQRPMGCRGHARVLHIPSMKTQTGKVQTSWSHYFTIPAMTTKAR